MKKSVLLGIIVVALSSVFLTACATQDKIMGQQVPDEQNIPLDQQMPPNNGQ